MKLKGQKAFRFKTTLIMLGVGILTLVAGVVYSLEKGSQYDKGLRRIMIGKSEVWVEIRDTTAGRAKGLSGRKELSPDEGMLFVFQSPGRPVFWMVGMEFYLDMIWISEGEVVQIDEMVPPPHLNEGRIQQVEPRQNIDMVLEVNGGYARREGIMVGDEFAW